MKKYHNNTVMTSVLDGDIIQLKKKLTKKENELSKLVEDRTCYTGFGINTTRKTRCGYTLKKYIILANKTVKRSQKLSKELTKNNSVSHEKQQILETISQIDYLVKKIQEEYDLEKDQEESSTDNTAISDNITQCNNLVYELDKNYRLLKGKIKCYTGTGLIHGFGFGSKSLKKCSDNIRPSVLDAKKILSEKEKYDKIVKKDIDRATITSYISLEDTETLRRSQYDQDDIFRHQNDLLKKHIKKMMKMIAKIKHLTTVLNDKNTQKSQSSFKEKSSKTKSSVKSHISPKPKSLQEESSQTTCTQSQSTPVLPEVAKKLNNLKIVNLYIVAHGSENLNNRLSKDLISNTFVNTIGKLNLSSIGYGLITTAKGEPPTDSINFDSFSQVWSIVDYLRDQFGKNPPSVVNESIARIYANEPVKKYGISKVSTETSEYTKQRLRRDRRPEEYMRSFQYEKKYTFHNDWEEDLMGVWIVGTQNVDQNITDLLMKPFRELKDSTVIEEVKANNLINKKNFDSLIEKFLSKVPSSKVKRNDLILEKHTPEDPVSGWILYNHPDSIPKYINVYTEEVKLIRPGIDRVKHQMFLLTDLLKLFKKMGFDHVNIVEDSCRTVRDYGDSISETLVREASGEEKKSYQSNLEGWLRRGFG
jgi:hypothetical protein